MYGDSETCGVTAAAAASVPAVKASGGGGLTARAAPAWSDWEVSFTPWLILCFPFAVQWL